MSKKIFYILVPFLIMSVACYAQKVGDKARGKASYYHSKFNGKKTASGEIYYASKMTCAHRTLPYGTMLKVTNRKNSKAVIVKVNDRGPFAKGRIVDLSFKAASRIDMIKDGVVDVEIEIVKAGTQIKDEPVVKKTTKEKPKTTSKKEKEAVEKKDKTVDVIKTTEKTVNDAKGVVGAVKKIFGSKKNKKQKESKKTSTSSKKTTTTSSNKKTGASSTTPIKKTASNTSGNFVSGKTYSVWGTQMTPQGYGVQIASYVDVKDAIKVGKEAHDLGLQPIFIQSGWANSKKVYRLIFGAYKTSTEASKQIVKAKSKGFNGAFVKKHF